jgi:hypothetical protein
MANKRPLVLGGRVVDGAVHFDNRKMLDAALKSWSGRVVVTIGPEQQRRSLKANSYLWGVVYRDAVVALREAGYTTLTSDQLHELMKDRHNAEVVLDPFSGEERRVVKSTRDLPVEDFGIFIERVMVDLAELCGISFPEPRKHEEWRERAA